MTLRFPTKKSGAQRKNRRLTIATPGDRRGKMLRFADSHRMPAKHEY
jgi:hypothetical protein